MSTPGELEIARSAWVAMDVAKEAQRTAKTRTDYCKRVGGGSCGKVKRPNLRSASVQPPQGDQSDLRSQERAIEETRAGLRVKPPKSNAVAGRSHFPSVPSRCFGRIGQSNCERDSCSVSVSPTTSRSCSPTPTAKSRSRRLSHASMGSGEFGQKAS